MGTKLYSKNRKMFNQSYLIDEHLSSHLHFLVCPISFFSIRLALNQHWKNDFFLRINYILGNFKATIFFNVHSLIFPQPIWLNQKSYQQTNASNLIYFKQEILFENLRFVYLILPDDWLNATKMLNDTFHQTLLDKQSPIGISTLDSFLFDSFHWICFI